MRNKIKMLWSPAILLLLVGAAIADPQNAWRDGKEYTYKIRSRTLAAFNPESKHYTGIVMEAHLAVQPNGPETLRAKVIEPRYSPIHTHLENGWDSEIPQNQVNLQSFPISGKPFEIKVKNGVVRDLIVDKDVPTWEVNILKSIVSQLQVDTQGENAENSKHNQFPEGDKPYALFKVMEDSVGGKCEVLYDISPLPEYMLQNNPELAPMPKLREHGLMISLIKTKNYSRCDQRVSYHFGLNGRNGWEPGSNDNGRVLSRASISRVIISGDLRSYTIQSSVTTNKVVLSPDQEENQRGLVASKMNLTLHRVEEISEHIPSPSNPESTGNLVYNYNNPFESTSTRRPNKLNHLNRRYSGEERKNKNSDESYDSDSSNSMYENDDNVYFQPRPKLTEPPKNPMLPFFIGHHGNSIQKNNKVDAVKSAKIIAKEIGNKMQKPDQMPDDETLEKFTILNRLVRIMNADQIGEVQRELYEQPQSWNQLQQNQKQLRARRDSWVAFRDAVANAGTGPALVNIKQWIKNKQVKGFEAADIINDIAKSTRTPTAEYMDTFFELASMEETKEQPLVRDAAIISFADLIRHAVVNKRSAHNRYPVHAFGRLFAKNNNNVHEKYLPYIAEELENAVNNKDSKKIQVYTVALGRTAHPRVLSFFEPYLEGKKQLSPYQRFMMVLSLYKLTTTHPKVARSVLYKIYSNNADYHEIRTAAVYLLMKTNPPTSMLQRMAEYTNYDSSKHVNSAVKSTIESLSELHEHEAHFISNAARAAVPFLTSEKYGPQYSRAVFKSYKNPQTHTGFNLEATYIGSDDSIIPKGVAISIDPTYLGLKIPRVKLAGAVSSVRGLWKFIEQKLDINQNKFNQKAQERKFSAENIAKLLEIRGDDPQQVEGFLMLSEINDNHFWSFDTNTLEKIPQQLKHWDEEMKKGLNMDLTKLENYEFTMSFPTETGYPLTYTMKVPTIMSITGPTKLRSEFDLNKQYPLPKSATVDGKVKIVYGMKFQKRLGFVTPFEHQEYIAGIDRNLQFYLPVRAEVQYDVHKKQAQLKLQPNEDELEYKILQFKTQPFTSKHDILSLQPVANDKNTHTIHKDRAQSSQYELNDQNNKERLNFKWERLSTRRNIERDNFKNKKDNAFEAADKMVRSIFDLFFSTKPEKTDYEKYSVKMLPVSDMNAEIRVSYDSLTTENKNDEDSENWLPNARAPHLDRTLSYLERKEKLLKESTKNINSAKANAVDVELQLNGGIPYSMAFTAAYGYSHVDPKSRGLMYVSAKSKDNDYHLSGAVESKTPNIKTLDYQETLKANNRHDFDAEIHYGTGSDENHGRDHKKVKIQGKLKQSEERKNEIQQSHDAQQCNKQKEQKGNKLTAACEKVNHRATSVDTGDVVITFENEYFMKMLAMEALDTAESLSQYQDQIRMYKTRENEKERNKFMLDFQLSPNDEHLDVTVKTPENKVRFENIRLGLIKYDDNNGNNKQNKDKLNYPLSWNNICLLDKTQAKTFDNHRYSLQLGKCWHVVMTTYPKSDPDRPSEKREIPRNMHVTILTRENTEGRKEMKITLGDKEIELLTAESNRVFVKVDGKVVEYSKKHSYQGKMDEKVMFELFELPDKSVKLVSDKYNIRIVFDGQRAEVEAGERYRDSVRGLCGNHDGEPANDQKTPKGCMVQNPEEFSAMYALTNDEKCEGLAQHYVEKARAAKCVFESPKPGNVISNQEAGRESERRQYDSGDESERRCTRHRTKVIKTDNKICFSKRPVPSCSSSCKPTAMKNKDVEFHCVDRTSASEKVAERVEKGANPDLSQKSVSKVEQYQVPVSCTA